MEKHIVRFSQMLIDLKRKWRIHTDIRNGEVCGGEFEITVGEMYITRVEPCWKWNTIGKYPTITARCKKCEKHGTRWEFKPDNVPSDCRITDRAWNEGPCSKRDDGSYTDEIPF